MKHTLETAFRCASRTRNVKKALVPAVDPGEDADTVGTVLGADCRRLLRPAGDPAAPADALLHRPGVAPIAE